MLRRIFKEIHEVCELINLCYLELKRISDELHFTNLYLHTIYKSFDNPSTSSTRCNSAKIDVEKDDD